MIEPMKWSSFTHNEAAHPGLLFSDFRTREGLGIGVTTMAGGLLRAKYPLYSFYNSLWL